MPSLPDSDFTSQPYTFTDSIDSQSFASMMATLSQNVGPMSGSILPEQSSRQASIMSSLQNKASATSSTLITSTTPTQNSASSQATPASSASGSSQISSAATVAATNTASLATTSNAGSSATSTASSAASSTTDDLHRESSSGLSSPGKQAAIAVPVVVVALAIIALLFFWMRRRNKRKQNEDPMEKMPAISDRKKRWSRHLRIFSFDTELLMGGRFSSTNSIRSRQTGSVRSTARSQHSTTASEQSVDEVAPPYRDALAAGAGGAVAGVGRSVSNATAPPPYLAPGRLATPTSPNPARSTHSNRNPFADTPPISPIDASPFNDPPGTSPAISRHSSLYRSVHDDASTIGGASDAASIREATLARNASVMSGGRIIDAASRN
ncbi:hypothetical protein H2198_001204 [Neophaeococcomyces mojaviensis]|uniref:Uncharacterized protein n=1 Tax=Neophaeococcomyces mojaviensis TaxID=3383035 RepID=A0ACC3AHK3_9EURO|nr:hypothetical protein H2198_001204 [Knufia sp. JES_112]